MSQDQSAVSSDPFDGLESCLPGRHHQPGYYSISDLPQRESVEKHCVTTGWWELDHLWKLYPCQFNVITGLAGHGKSTLLQNVIVNVAREVGMRSFLYVPENEGFIRSKLAAIWGDNGGLDYFEKEQCFVQSCVPTRYDVAAKTLNWILDMAVVAVEKDQCDLVVIDPWNEVERAKPKDMLMTDYIGECLMLMKQFCRTMGVTMAIIAHPTKAHLSHGGAPTLADIEGSMNWYNKCDNGLIVVRDPSLSTCKVISAKVREIGAGKRGECHFSVDEKTGRFTPQTGAVSL